jgi:hypothetical protein
VRELVCIVGRRGGKDSIASLIATHAAILDRSDRLRPGERCTVLCLATDRAQASIVHRYIAGYFRSNPLLRKLITRETQETLELGEAAEIRVGTSDFRAVRGLALGAAVLDEAAFWVGDGISVDPATEVYQAIVPAMASLLPDAIVVIITTPRGKKGLAFDRYRRYYGVSDDDVLVVQGSSRDLNPLVPQSIIDAAFAEDPVSAAAEWHGQFRNDLDAFVTREVMDSVTIFQRYELAPEGKRVYTAFADAAGGSGGDSFTCAVGHREGEIAVIDAVREIRPPFSPTAAVEEIASLLGSYRVRELQCDKWGAAFVTELFAKHGVRAEQSADPKSTIYSNFLAIANSGRCQLLDHPKATAQFLSLERRVARGGKDSIDHPPLPTAHDDLANAIAGCVVRTLSSPGLDLWAAMVGQGPLADRFIGPRVII